MRTMGTHTLVVEKDKKQMFMILYDKSSCTCLLLWKLEEKAPTKANFGGQGRLPGERDFLVES